MRNKKKIFRNSVPCPPKATKIILIPVKDLGKIFYKIVNLRMWARDIAENSEIRPNAFQDGIAPHLKSPEILTVLKFSKEVKMGYLFDCIY